MKRSRTFDAAGAIGRGRTAWGTLVLALVAGSPAAGEAPSDVELELRLHGALLHANAPGAAERHGHTLLAPLRRRGGHWDYVAAYAGAGPRTVHGGRVVESTLTDNEIQLALELEVAGDYTRVPWGRASYRVTLQRQADGRFAGSQAGTYLGVEVKGDAEATLPPPRRKMPDYVPVQPGEHPRILFRKSDLQALRERAKTPFGQAALAAMKGPAALGLKYQLTGDERLAQECMGPVIQLMAEGIYSDHRTRVGDKANQIAVAYDCCYAAWPDRFKRLVEGYFARLIRNTFHQHEDFLSTGINWHVCSNWSAPIYMGAGYAGLALWGEKGPEPPKPEEPAAVISIPPAADYVPGKGVPVVPLSPDALVGKWLITKPVNLYIEEDQLRDRGGVLACRPEVGMTFVCGVNEVDFAPLPEGLMTEKGAVNMPKILPKPLPTLSDATLYLYAVLANDSRRTLKVHCPRLGNAKPKAFLSGRPAADGQLIDLEKGLYPVTILYTASARGHVPWSPFEFALAAASDADLAQAKAALPARQAEHRKRLEEWERDVADWKRTGGLRVEYTKLFHKGHLGMVLHYREGVGTGGFQAETGGYSQNATGPASLHAAAYRTMFGEAPTPYDDIALWVPRKMFAHHVPPNGKPIAQDINGITALVGLPALFPLIRDEWMPAVLWFWKYLHGARAEQRLIEDDPLRAFLYYPLDTPPKPPQGVMPLTWEAPSLGYYGFRSSWEGKDDFIVQVFLKSHPIRGWSGANAGSFRVWGLGHAWACGPTARERCRALENVVVLPEDALNDSACGRLLAARVEKDGSGVVSVDLRDVYAARNEGIDEDLYEYYGGGRNALAFKETGIAGLRSIAVDYSGRSGAPCLIAIVDRIRGGKSKVWTWQLAENDMEGYGAKRKDVRGPDAKVSGNTFVIAKAGGAAMRGMALSPVRPQVKAEIRSGAFHNAHSGDMKYSIPGIFITGEEPAAGEFFVIVTIQRGDPPAIRVDGEGLKSVATVGKRRVSFDGEKIVLD
jgi:hypothetical protein